LALLPPLPPFPPIPNTVPAPSDPPFALHIPSTDVADDEYVKLLNSHEYFHGLLLKNLVL
jgi:hypothetical protein